jgi:hypothetical protein
MGVEFRLGRQDAHKAEDFLARRPDGVSAVTLDTAYARYQLDAAEAAREAGVDVLYDPATERMADRGYEPAGVSFFTGDPFDVDLLARKASERTRLVDGALDQQARPGSFGNQSQVRRPDRCRPRSGVRLRRYPCR